MLTGSVLHPQHLSRCLGVVVIGKPGEEPIEGKDGSPEFVSPGVVVSKKWKC